MIEYDTFIYLDNEKAASRWVADTLRVVCATKPSVNYSHKPLEQKTDKSTFISVRNPFEASLSTFVHANARGSSGVANHWYQRYERVLQSTSDVKFKVENIGKSIEFKRFMYELVEMFPYGLQTGRYLRLALGLPDTFDQLPDGKGVLRKTPVWLAQVDEFFEGKTYEEVVGYEAQNSIVDYVVRVESLADDLIHVLKETQPKLHPNWESEVRGREKTKINSSKHAKSETYYDDELIELVTRNERFMIEKFGYTYGSNPAGSGACLENR